MNTRARTALKAMTHPTKNNKISRSTTTTIQEKKAKEVMLSNGGRSEKPKQTCGLKSRRERKLALQQDVDKLKKKLRHEENVHRALARAFTRPLGALPRLPPYLPPYTLELLAEVAVLEEEVVRLEEQVVNFRHGLYQEAIYVSSSSGKRTEVNSDDPPANCLVVEEDSPPFSDKSGGSVATMASSFDGGRWGKENHWIAKPATRNKKQSQSKRASKPLAMKLEELQQEKEEEEACLPPNKISEELLRCLIGIFCCSKKAVLLCPLMASSDPYKICKGFGRRDIGPYKHLRSLDAGNFSLDRASSSSSFLLHRLRILLQKLELVELTKVELTHQQKLAFWINIYNSCMMNAFLEQGIPSNPQMVVELMLKALINIGGHSLSAMTIEHFILRSPFRSESGNEYKAAAGRRGQFGLDRPEPMVTFALACGSWSSPAVRVYTAARVEEELEEAKRDYLQAAVGVPATPESNVKVAIPKLLDWYMLDFARDVDSLADWVCIQLPEGELRDDAARCLEAARRRISASAPVQVLSYDFSFRYLLEDWRAATCCCSFCCCTHVSQ